MTAVDFDLYELDLLCDACDSYIDELQKIPRIVGAAERAEMLLEKLNAAACEAAKQNTANRP